MRRLLRRHPVAAFYLLTLLLTWSLWSLPVLHRFGFTGEPPAWWQLGSFGPSLAGLLVAAALGRRRLKQLLSSVVQWRVDGRWYAVVFLLPPGMLLVPLALHLAAGDTLQLTALQPAWTLPLLFAQILFLGGPLNEELGWRGLALPALQRQRSALTSSLIVGAIWAFWHLPLFLAGAPGYTQVPLPLYVLEVLGLSVVFTWLFNATGGSVLLAILLHATWNTTLWYTLPMWGDELIRDVLVFTAALWAFAAFLIVHYGSSTLSPQDRATLDSTDRTERA